ncbi:MULTISPECIES: hypothetical protein [Kamptonema]|uniref:hypothetical protein n=1 Tax=Kamptonema TaxID=1501433 RepID=UPI0011D1FEFC|nr:MULTISPECIES: hypothetical protein [Kamptonema]
MSSVLARAIASVPVVLLAAAIASRKLILPSGPGLIIKFAMLLVVGCCDAKCSHSYLNIDNF